MSERLCRDGMYKQNLYRSYLYEEIRECDYCYLNDKGYFLLLINFF